MFAPLSDERKGQFTMSAIVLRDVWKKKIDTS